jgi:hypothetical protein
MAGSLYENDGCNFEVVIETPNPSWHPRVRALYRLAGKKLARRWQSANDAESDMVGAELICQHLVDLWMTDDAGQEQRIDVQPTQVAGFKKPIFDGLLSHVLGIIPPRGNPVGKSGGASGSPSFTQPSPSVNAPTVADGSTTMDRAGLAS